MRLTTARVIRYGGRTVGGLDLIDAFGFFGPAQRRATDRDPAQHRSGFLVAFCIVTV